MDYSVSADDVRRLSDKLGLGITDGEIEGVVQGIRDSFASYARVDEITPLPSPQPLAARGRKPLESENPLGAWYWMGETRHTAPGILSGYSVVMKDNISVAGLPLSNGSRVLDGFISTRNATVVDRVLDNGGDIPGKAVCEDLCFSGNSFTSATGPVHNPYDFDRSSGGSSSGCAVLVATGEVDMAIGADQGGSVRGPAAWSGITALKPTYGLVPYTGIFPVEITLDHAGPMARTARDVALLMDAIAGPDGLDPRQHSTSQEFRPAFSRHIGGDVRGLRIGILQEGFGWQGLSEPAVDGPVNVAAAKFEELGCSVELISIPLHRDAIHIFTPIMSEGSTAQMFRGNTGGSNWRGRYDVDLLEAFRDGWRANAHQMSMSTKLDLLVGTLAHDRTGGSSYARAQNLVPVLKAAYDHAFGSVDVLIMPTLPMSPRVLPTHDLPPDLFFKQALDMSCNNCAANLTGHPAVSVPCAIEDGLPVGMMLVGRMGQDALLLKLAHAFQSQIFAPPAPDPKFATGAPMRRDVATA